MTKFLRLSLLLGSVLSLAACPSDDVADDDVADDEVANDESTTEESGTETSDGDVCELPASEPVASAQAQALTLTNSGATPLFVYPLPCSATNLASVVVDRETYYGGSRHPCPGVPPCYDSCDGHYYAPAIRVDPGASFEMTFTGYVYTGASVPQACRPDCFEPDISGCGVGHVVPEGASVTAELRIASSCEGSACECGGGTGACELTPTDDGDASFDSLADVAVDFVHGQVDPIEVDLAGG